MKRRIFDLCFDRGKLFDEIDLILLNADKALTDDDIAKINQIKADIEVLDAEIRDRQADVERKLRTAIPIYRGDGTPVASSPGRRSG